MASIQWQALILYYQIRNFISPPSKVFNLKNERLGLEEISKLFKPLTELKVTQVDVNGVSGEWLSPPNVVDGRTILYFHGGYYMIGSIQSHRNLAGNIAAAAQARALIIDYRLAPEHPFPCGLEDAITAYKWLLAQGLHPKQIFFAGDSAGGGMVLSTLLASKDRGIALPAAGVCMSPATDLTGGGESWKYNLKKELVINRTVFDQVQPLYLQDHNAHEPLASPLYGDLHGLPPLLIQVGSDEVLLSDAESFADAARKAGVVVTLEVWPGMQHVWQLTASMIPEAREAINRIGEFISNR
jgi:monoterpene epsilon-lactone hydrolase